MAWATPAYDWKEVDAAGRALAASRFPIDDADGIAALPIINNWRSSHSYPLNTFQTTLRGKAKKIEQDITVAQRIKRLESIHAKLSRQRSMRMTQMQDIAGCPVVFKNSASVQKLVRAYTRGGFPHKLRSEKDYISNPKRDGYRCHHLVFDYNAPWHMPKLKGLRVEIQVRTQVQHAWATAVEAVGIFTKQALKSNQGSEDWLRFFSLMSAAMAAIEGTSPVPETPMTRTGLVDEISPLAEKLNVADMLETYNTTLTALGAAKDAKYFLVSLNPSERSVTAKRFKASESQQANEQYTAAESEVNEGSSVQIALVSVESINALQRAYPNYFLDTRAFSKIVQRVLTRNFPEPKQPALV